MTGCADDTTGSLGFAVDAFQGSKDVPLPRFCLRKRKPCAERGAAGIPSVSSALLDGIFADVAEILLSEETESAKHEASTASPVQSATNISEQDTAFLPEISPPSKKSRTSLTHSISRSPKSFKWMGELLFPSNDNIAPSLVTPSSFRADLTSQISGESKKRTIVSLHKVSDWYTSTSPEPSPSFPHLPPAVSVSSCNTLPRVQSDLHAPMPDSDGKESYGWFVEMDNAEEEKETADPYSLSPSSNDLAFVASTAPSVGNHDAEVEWAKAADTVDSVLGDFF
ncbi:hypothetical protein ACA910_005068 [Epithemia clementina (nom. ined.)]